MARVISAVPNLVTSVLGMTSAPPPAPVVIQAPAPTPDPTPTPTDTKPADTSISGSDLSADVDGGIDTRSRGRLGTIATSFRGVLNDSTNTLSRRTLLGE